ncbi:MAG: hypothetical protein QXP55_01805 [Nitrososphaerales archaeon]
MTKHLSHKLKLSEPIDLEKSFYPSFVSTLFRKFDDWWVKIHGYRKGAKIKVKDNRIFYKGAHLSEVYLWTGLWYNPHNALAKIKVKKIDKIIEAYKGLKLIISPQDCELLFITIFLSRRTTYHKNVITWTDMIFNQISSLEDLISFNTRCICNSYQLKQLPIASKEYIKKVRHFENLDHWTLRKVLLSIKWVGPKVADAYLLFAKGITYLAPSDTHYFNFVKRLRLFDFSKIPNKKLCIKYTCTDCPVGDDCLTGISFKRLNELSGWLQTVAYVHDKLYCSKKQCVICMFKDICSGVVK